MKNRDHYLYNTWTMMKQRTGNPNATGYQRYGGRGIKIHQDWMDFWVFAQYIDENLGVRPDGCTLDRIDNDGDYEPGNVKWSNQRDQVKNSHLKPNKMYPGVHKTGKGGYEARIVKNGKRITLGTYRTPYEAACKYAEEKGLPVPLSPITS